VNESYKNCILILILKKIKNYFLSNSYEMTKCSIVLIKWDILNKGRIEKKLCIQKINYNGESPLYIGIDE